MTKFYIDFHDAAVYPIVSSNYEYNQFITWNCDKTFFVYEFGQDQSVCQVDRFQVSEEITLQSAISHAKSYFKDMANFRVYA